MPSDLSRQLWNIGVPLSEAWRRFADPSAIARLDQFPGLLNSFNAKITAAGSAKSLMVLIDTTNETIAEVGGHWQLQIELQEELLDRLFNGDLAVTAYRESPSTSASAILIAPDDIEFAEPDWEKSRISFDGKTFGRVRVTDKTAMTNTLMANRQSGRKGSREAIQGAVDRLAINRPEIRTLLRKEACQLIRVELHMPDQFKRGLSDINLSKYLVRKFGPNTID